MHMCFTELWVNTGRIEHKSIMHANTNTSTTQAFTASLLNSDNTLTWLMPFLTQSESENNWLLNGNFLASVCISCKDDAAIWAVTELLHQCVVIHCDITVSSSLSNHSCQRHSDDRLSVSNYSNTQIRNLSTISRSKNVILKILMCLTGVLSDYMFLCSKYGVNCVCFQQKWHKRCSDAYIHSINGCIFVVLSAFIWIVCVFICICSFSVYVAYVAAFWRNK